ncbi:MAG TPA: UDP-glucose/GDP-mannose dehydrogenase family protein [Euzebyales bacterium]
MGPHRAAAGATDGRRSQQHAGASAQSRALGLSGNLLRVGSVRCGVRVGVIGTGHVGLVTAGAMASIGHVVVGVDNDEAKIALLQDGTMPFHEPGMSELLQDQEQSGRLRYSTDPRDAIAGKDVVFICVSTPPREDGSPNLSFVQAAAASVAEHATASTVVAEKSTVPVRTGQRIREALALEARANRHGFTHEVVSNPEFLREGTAVADTLRPDRVVVGADSAAGHEVMRRLYAPLLAQHDCPYIATDVRTAELIKHASNAYLATKISFINAIARICELAGADVETVADAMGHDARIGRAFLNAGLGYGGSCFPKDVRAFVHIADELGYDFGLLRETERINREAHAWPVQQLRRMLWNLEDKTIAILGLSFKPGTDDIRDAPALHVIEELLAEGAKIRAHDPAAMEHVSRMYPELTYVDKAEEALRDAHAVVVCTEWEEYRDLDAGRIADLLAYPVVVDARNVWSSDELAAHGLTVARTGQPAQAWRPAR